MKNIDEKVVEGFGEEWERYDHANMPRNVLEGIFNSYFSIFPWEAIPENAVGFDMGCGSGRWARFVAPRVGILHCIDPSTKALAVARRNLKDFENCRFHLAGTHDNPIPDGSASFGYSLGVLHHVPETLEALKSCTAKLKPGAPFLIYLYYAFDNRPAWFRIFWSLSDSLRKIVSKMPFSLRSGFSRMIAFFIYLPIARCSLILEKLGIDVDVLPLSFYRHQPFYVMCNDALDRFGTLLEHRFTKIQIQQMMEKAGLENIRFKMDAPYWCAVGNKICAESLDSKVIKDILS
ncbi:MAG: class I SAM-dependent methyltransferase [Desulfobacterales bacterium]|nr:class I SAM-dependent methyltransferase [Desulfobacterales bacterium]